MRKQHYFLDEAGDPTFYGKGKRIIIGQQGVSTHFILGMVSFGEALEEIRAQVLSLQQLITGHVYFGGITSIQQKKSRTGYFFHTTDDIPEVRKLFYDFIRSIDCCCELVVVKKVPEQFAAAHQHKSDVLYADMLSCLLQDKLTTSNRVIMNIAKRRASTRHENLNLSLKKAIIRHQQQHPEYVPTNNIMFNVQDQLTEPLLNVADYLCWSVQRAFERGETRFFEYMKDKIKVRCGID